VDLLRNVGVVLQLDVDALAFPEAEQRTRKLIVVKRRRENVIG
jgi:hypothetical protein